MSKDAFWFKHDSNASRDLRLMEIKAIYGYEGLGLFWAIIEILREQNNYIWANDKINVLASLIGIDETKLTNLISDCKRNGLLKHTENYIYSDRLLKDMKVWETKRNNGSKTTGNQTARPKPYRNHTETIPLKKKRVDIEERKRLFTNTVFEHINYSEDIRNRFCSYWTEHNSGGAKMRFEMEKVFDISKRLSTWANNNFNKPKKTDTSFTGPKFKELPR